VLPKKQSLKQYTSHLGDDIDVCFLNSGALSAGGGVLSLSKQLLSILQQIVAAFFVLYRTKEARLVHVQDSVTLLVWWIPSFFLGRKVLWHIRCTTKDNFLYKTAFGLADGLLFVSSIDKNFERMRGMRHEGKVIEFAPNIKNLNRSKVPNRRTKKTIELIQVGCKGDRKRLPFTLKFFNHLIEHNIDVRLKLVGLTDVEMLMIKSNYSSIMHLIEQYPWFEDVQSLMCKSDVLILPSRDEAFGRVQLEALDSGLIILAAKSQASETVVGLDKRIGFIVKDDNLSEWTKALLLIIERKINTKSVNTGEVSFPSKYLFKNNVERLKAFYSAVDSSS
jgi:glycosyltransferase involved in cell wall biosynthesis